MADTIVVGHDGSEASQAAVEVAIEMAKAWPGSEVVVTCAVHQPIGVVGRPTEDTAYAADRYLHEMAPIMEEILEGAAATVRSGGVKCATACMHGEPVDIMLKVADEVGARFIVVGSTGAGLMADLLGSTTTRLLRKSHLPVVVVPKPEHE
jgi:nucleotide-binding universal stress UspA family protein